MINKINNEQVHNFVEKSGSCKPPVNKARANNEPDATLQVDFASLIEQARLPADETGAVEKARRLLKTGQLETRENIRQAAENILKQGI